MTTLFSAIVGGPIHPQAPVPAPPDAGDSRVLTFEGHPFPASHVGVDGGPVEAVETHPLDAEGGSSVILFIIYAFLGAVVLWNSVKHNCANHKNEEHSND